MKINLFVFCCILFLFSSCNKNKAKITMTFNKGTAVYADLESIRSTSLIASAKEINDPGKIFIDENILLIGEKNKGIHIFDNTNPNAPINLSFINIPYCKEFYVDQNIIYAESHYDFLKIDINDLNSPVLIQRIEEAFGNLITNKDGQTLVSFDFNIETASFELDSPEAQELSKTSSLFYNYKNNLIPPSSVPSSFIGSKNSSKGTLNKITTGNNYVYVVGGSDLYIFENQSSNMNQLQTLKYISSDIETIYPEGNRLYIGTKSAMITYDISNPASPTREGSYFHPTSCDPVLPNGNTAYLTLRTADFSGCSGDQNSLHVIDVSNQSLEKIEEIAMSSPYGMNIINNYLFVGEGNNGLTIFNANNPSELALIKNISDVEVYDIIKHPTNPNIILTTSENGLEQYNIDFNDLTINLLSRVNY